MRIDNTSKTQKWNEKSCGEKIEAPNMLPFMVAQWLHVKALRWLAAMLVLNKYMGLQILEEFDCNSDQYSTQIASFTRCFKTCKKW